MESRLQQLLRARREQAELDRLLDTLGELVVEQEIPVAEPEWTQQAIRVFWRMSTEPAATLSGNADTAELAQWVESLLGKHGINGRFYVASHLSIRPWLDCVAEPGWFPTMHEAFDQTWVFASRRFDIVAAVHEAEYRYEFFVARQPEDLENC